MSEILKPPERRGDWLIFPQTASKEKGLMTCANTVSGICTQPETLEACIQQCEKVPYCLYGYYISKPEKFCLPMAGGLYYPHFDPVMRWSNIENNPEFRNIKITSFLRKKDSRLHDFIQPKVDLFPDPYSNTVYFEDRVHLINSESGLGLFVDDKIIERETITLNRVNFASKFSPLKIIYPNPYNQSVVTLSDLPYNFPLVLLLENTGFILTKGTDDYMQWVLQGRTEILADNQIKIIAENLSENIHVAYGSNFYLGYAGRFLGLDKDFNLKFYNQDISTLKNYGIKVTFAFRSLMSVFTCQGEKCEKIPQNLLEAGNPYSLYKQSRVFRSPTCFGYCKPDLKSAQLNIVQKSGNFWIILLLILIIFYLILLRRLS